MSIKTEVALEYISYAKSKPQALRNFIDTIITQINRMNHVKSQEKKEKFAQTTAYIIKNAYSELLIDFECYVKYNWKSRIHDTDLLTSTSELQAIEELWTLTPPKKLKPLLSLIINDFQRRFASEIVASYTDIIKNHCGE